MEKGGINGFYTRNVVFTIHNKCDHLLVAINMVTEAYPCFVIFRLFDSQRMENICVYQRGKLWPVSVSRSTNIQPMEMAGSSHNLFSVFADA